MGPIAPVYLGSSGHQDETVRSDSRPEIHLGGQRAGNKEKFCQKTRFAQMLGNSTRENEIFNFLK